MESLISFDIHLFNLINQSWTSPALDIVFFIWTEVGHRIWMLLLLAPFFYYKGSPTTRHFLIVLVPLVFISDALSSRVLQPLFERARPFIVFPDARLMVPAESVNLYGFPSTHSTNIFTAATLAAWTFPKFKVLVPLFLLCLVTAYSRVYIGVHFPADTAAGAILGFMLGSAGRLAGWLVWERKK